MMGIFGIFLMLAGFVILVRNMLVADEKNRVLQLVSKEAEKDQASGREWMWRFNEYEKITYTSMVLSFWRPVGSFYLDNPCLKPGERNG